MPLDSKNVRFKRAYFRIRRLAKVEREIEERKKTQAKRDNKRYPCEMLHVDTKRLPLLSGQRVFDKREYLFVGIDDFSRELYAAIMSDKTAFSAAEFLQKHVIEPCPYTIECVYSDNGREYQGTEKHEFAMVCDQNGINQKFTRPARPQTNGKAERVIRTLMEMWHTRIAFTDSEHRKRELVRFINFYNTVKPHSALTKTTQNGKKQIFTPYEWLEDYFYSSECK